MCDLFVSHVYFYEHWVQKSRLNHLPVRLRHRRRRRERERQRRQQRRPDGLRGPHGDLRTLLIFRIDIFNESRSYDGWSCLTYKKRKTALKKADLNQSACSLSSGKPVTLITKSIRKAPRAAVKISSSRRT